MSAESEQSPVAKLTQVMTSIIRDVQAAESRKLAAGIVETQNMLSAVIEQLDLLNTIVNKMSDRITAIESAVTATAPVAVAAPEPDARTHTIVNVAAPAVQLTGYSAIDFGD